MSENRTYSCGLSFDGALTILFIALKLTGVVKFSWVWVLSPLWIPLVLVVFLIVLFSLIALLCRD